MANIGSMHLSNLAVTLLGIQDVVGAAVFNAIGTAVTRTPPCVGAESSLWLSSIITPVARRFTALGYVELATTVPVFGSTST